MNDNPWPMIHTKNKVRKALELLKMNPPKIDEAIKLLEEISGKPKK